MTACKDCTHLIMKYETTIHELGVHETPQWHLTTCGASRKPDKFEPYTGKMRENGFKLCREINTGERDCLYFEFGDPLDKEKK